MQTDAQLVKATLAGDSNAFNELIERYQSAVYGLGLSIVGNVHDAQDIAQETFVSAYLSLEKLQNPERFGAWLCGICRNFWGATGDAKWYNNGMRNVQIGKATSKPSNESVHHEVPVTRLTSL